MVITRGPIRIRLARHPRQVGARFDARGWARELASCDPDWVAQGATPLRTERAGLWSPARGGPYVLWHTECGEGLSLVPRVALLLRQ